MKELFKHEAEMDFGTSGVHLEFDNTWASRQVEICHRSWFRSADLHSELGLALCDQPLSELGSPSITHINRKRVLGRSRPPQRKHRVAVLNEIRAVDLNLEEIAYLENIIQRAVWIQASKSRSWQVRRFLLFDRIFPLPAVRQPRADVSA